MLTSFDVQLLAAVSSWYEWISISVFFLPFSVKINVYRGSGYLSCVDIYDYSESWSAIYMQKYTEL